MTYIDEKEKKAFSSNCGYTFKLYLLIVIDTCFLTIVFLFWKLFVNSDLHNQSCAKHFTLVTVVLLAVFIFICSMTIMTLSNLVCSSYKKDIDCIVAKTTCKLGFWFILNKTLDLHMTEQCHIFAMVSPRNTNWRGRSSTYHLHAPTCLVLLLYTNKTSLTF